MAFNTEEFRSQLVFGGARNALFSVQIFNPVAPASNIKMPFLVRASDIPDSKIGVISVPYFGRIVKYAGDRTFDPWTVRVINDEDFVIRNALEQWQNMMSGLQNNIRTVGPLPNQYKSQANIIQYGKTNVPIRQYTFYGLWPQVIQDIPVDWAQQDTIEEFQVTFAYDFWLVSGGSTGNAGGAL